MTAAQLIRVARTQAGITQSGLADRLGTTQTAVARLERRGANPRLGTLSRALRATGHRLELQVVPRSPNVDESLVARNLRMSPAERLEHFTTAHREVESLRGRARGR